jgi:hypothetical protein
MTDSKEKSKPVVPTRTPKKKIPGIFDNLRKIPQPHPVEEMLGLVPPTIPTPSTPSTPSRASSDTDSSITPENSVQGLKKDGGAIAPQRDFTRVANSIVREAIPSGLFGGKSKQLYDYLYLLTRGSIIPTRTIRIPKDKLMKGAGIGSEVTLRTNLAKLNISGLVIERVFAGTHGGNEYEVFLPEEAENTPSTPSTPSRGGNPLYPLSKLEGVEALETTPSRGGLNPIESEVSGEPKTFFKTNTESDDDDAALAGLVATLSKATREVTGRELSSAERERWREVAEVLVAELKIAAARTTVSSVPSFLAEHLRRRLWKVDKRQARAEGTELPDEAMKTAPSIDTAKCPDCGGSGWWYPEGLDKGVKKCTHEKLLTST